MNITKFYWLFLLSNQARSNSASPSVRNRMVFRQPVDVSVEASMIENTFSNAAVKLVPPRAYMSFSI